MRNLTKCFLIAAMVLIAAYSLTAAQEAKWFDMENCGFCKALMTPPDMLEHATWEHHNIANGIVSVTTVDKEYIGPWRAAEAKMEETGKKMEKGEQVGMCNACMGISSLMMKGAKWESVQTTHGSVAMMTSSDAEVVKEIQAWGKKTMDEMAKMEMEHKHDHEKKTKEKG
ncbi:MAG: hypothetical protein ABIA59_11130 [Candidatus Latescibacterota bacterium]